MRALVLALLFAGAAAAAQTTTGMIFGTVKDTDGAVMPGVTVRSSTLARTPGARRDGRARRVHRPAAAARHAIASKPRCKASRASCERAFPSRFSSRSAWTSCSRLAQMAETVDVDGRRIRARDDDLVGRQGGRQRAHPGAAAEHAQRLRLDLSDARRHRRHRQLAQPGRLLGERRARRADGDARRWIERGVSDRQRLPRHLGLSVRRCRAGVQGAGRQLQRRVRPQPRQRLEPRLQIRHEHVSRHRRTSSIATRSSTRTPTSTSCATCRSPTSRAVSSAA